MMILEQLAFIVIAFALFVLIFLKMIQKNDTTYIAVLILEAIGIAISFIEILCSMEISIALKIVRYILSLILPLAIIVLEKKKINFAEVFSIAKAKIYLLIGKKKQAKKILINLVTKYENSYYGHKMLAKMYEGEGGMRKAIDEYVQLIDIRKNDYDSYYTIAKLLSQLNKKNEATQMLTNLLSKKPEYNSATELLGELLLEQEKYKEAVHVYMNGLKYNPASYELQYNLAIAYTMLNDFQSAKACYEKAATLNSLIYNTKYSLAEIALIYKELDEAEAYFLQASEDEELSADCYFELSKIALIRGDKQMAIKYVNTAIDINARKIVPKVKNNTIFIPILARISIPFNLDIENEKDKKLKLTEKEIRAKEHLEEMFEITRKIGYNDINVLKKSKIQEEQKLVNPKEREN